VAINNSATAWASVGLPVSGKRVSLVSKRCQCPGQTRELSNSDSFIAAGAALVAFPDRAPFAPFPPKTAAKTEQDEPDRDARQLAPHELRNCGAARPGY